MTGSHLPDDSERGMALVETLVACAIIAAMLGVLFQVMQSTARATGQLRFERQAALVAQSVMARVGADIALNPGVTDGHDQALAWQVTIDRYREGAPSTGGDPALFDVRVSVVADGSNRPRYELHSLRLSS